ncbi:MAG: TraB/GumN family protein [Clostridia bacterium]|nr:TraB/GumN family protein [Clostridia bacterium]
MNLFWKRMLCLTAIVLTPALLCGCEKREPAQGICYRINGGKNPMVILGSIHVGSPDMEPYGEHILQSMKDADTFVFECDSGSTETALLAQQMMVDPQGDLRTKLSQETWQLLEEACRVARMAPDSLRQYKPWAVTSMLATHAAADEMGARNSRHAASLGVEEIVEKYVGNKETLYLETALAQFEAMDSFSPSLQEALLAQGCDAVLSPKENTQLANWPVWWHRGQAQAFADEYLQDESLPPELLAEYHFVLVTARNRTMADRLVSMLESNEPHTYFVTVGLMHLVLPEDSILALLRGQGYTVEQLFTPAQ